MPVPQRAGRPHHASCAHPLCGRSFVFYNILALFRRFWCLGGVLLYRTFCPSVQPHDLTQFLGRTVVPLIAGRAGLLGRGTPWRARTGGSRTAPTLAGVFLAQGQDNPHLAVNRAVERRFLPQEHLPSLPRRSQAGVPLDRVFLLLRRHLLLERRLLLSNLLLHQALEFLEAGLDPRLTPEGFLHILA